MGRTPAAIRDAEKDGRLPEPPRTETNRRVGYTLAQVNDMRGVFGTRPWRKPEDPCAVIAVQNFKGGVGKSTLSVHLAQYLAIQGYRVALIDCDSQASSTTLFGYVPDLDLTEDQTLYPFLREDDMRSPTGDGTTTRKWTVLEQALPVPFPIGSGDLNNAGWIPQVDTLQEVFANMRRHSSFLAYHDSDDQFKPTEGTADGRLIGRSVWNTRWLLIIPAGTLSSDREEGLAQFINGPEVDGVRTGDGVADILICFETYAYSGGKKAAKTSIPSALPVQKQ